MLSATAFADLPCVAGVAALFTLLAAPSIARAARDGGAALEAEERRHTVAGAAVGLWVGAGAGYASWACPAWMLSYADGLREMPTLVWYPAFSLGLMALGALGAWLSFACLVHHKARAARLLAGGWFFLWLVFFAATVSRALVAGTWAQFEAGTALPLTAQPRLLALLLLSWALTASGLLVAFVRRARAEREASASHG